MYSEDDLLPVSSLAQLVYCERRCALIHIEGIWDENQYTAEGKILHERVDRGGSITRPDVRVAYAVGIRSLRLGLVGKADVVEFHFYGESKKSVEEAKTESRGTLDELLAEIGMDSAAPIQQEVKSAKGRWVPFPVEHKRGRLKMDFYYEVQLCAQAMCLEEMTGVQVPAGALYYGASHRRKQVTFDDKLRAMTEATAERLHRLIAASVTPKPVYSKKCDLCSLVEGCLPKTIQKRRSVKSYLTRILGEP